MRKDNSKIIPVMHCFNNLYVVPGAVSFYSMLSKANPAYDYRLYVLHSDITLENQEKLTALVKQFPNAELHFYNMQNKFRELFEKTVGKGHYSREIYYKFLASSIFPEYDHIIITDVDVLWLDDISSVWIDFLKEDNVYLAGVNEMRPESHGEICEAYKDFSADDAKKVTACAGFWLFNLKLMRRDGMEQKFIDYALENAWRLTQPEQQTVNIVCYPKILQLHPRHVVIAWNYRQFQNEKDLEKDVHYTPEVIREALEHPVQLHYAGKYKPWNTIFVTKSWLWFRELWKTSFVKEEIKIFFAHNLLRDYFRDFVRKYINSSVLFYGFYRIYRVFVRKNK